MICLSHSVTLIQWRFLFVCLSGCVPVCVCLLVSVATTGTCASDERVVIMRVSVSICLCVCLYVCLCTTRCGVVCVCLCVCLSVCLYVSLCVCICLCVSVGVSVLLDSGRVYFCICLSFCLSVYVYEVLEVLVHLCRAFNCRILYDHYLPTVILIIIGIPSPTHSFTLGSNPSFSANPPYRSLSFFYFRIYYMDFPDCLLLLLSISVFLLFSFFCFYTF